MPEQRHGKKAVNELRVIETYKKTKKKLCKWGQHCCLTKASSNYACFYRQTTMLTQKIIKETIENLFQFDIDNDKS